MRFLIGLLVGLAIGFVGAILFAPERRAREESLWETPREGEESEAVASGNHDMLGALRRTLRSLQEQVQEAWAEAVVAADEAEKEMWARYQRTARRPGRRAASRQ